MSYLVSGFSGRMGKRATSAQGEIAPSSEVAGGKRPKLFDPNEEAQKNPMVIKVDSPDGAFNAQLALEGAPQDVSREAYAPPEDGILTKGSLSAERVLVKAPLKVAAASSFPTRLASVGPHRTRMHDWLELSSCVPPQEWVHSLANTLLAQRGLGKSLTRWSPLNKKESLVTHMRDLYPTLLRVPVVAHVEQYSIPFPYYMDRETFQCVAKSAHPQS